VYSVAVDLCEAIGCAPIITFNDRELPQDAADFVEYCWGDANTTWGSRRIADGHPDVYNVTHVEVSAFVHFHAWQRANRRVPIASLIAVLPVPCMTQVKKPWPENGYFLLSGKRSERAACRVEAVRLVMGEPPGSEDSSHTRVFALIRCDGVT